MLEENDLQKGMHKMLVREVWEEVEEGEMPPWQFHTVGIYFHKSLFIKRLRKNLHQTVYNLLPK